MKGSKRWLVAAVCLTAACILEGVGAARYLSRLPDDWIGIGLYIAASVLFGIAAFGFYTKWIREKHKEEQEPSGPE